MKAFLKEIFTDAKGRPEIKNILGVTMAVVGIIAIPLKFLGVFTFTLADWITFMGFAVGLLTISAAADSAIDAKKE